MLGGFLQLQEESSIFILTILLLTSWHSGSDEHKILKHRHGHKENKIYFELVFLLLVILRKPYRYWILDGIHIRRFFESLIQCLANKQIFIAFQNDYCHVPENFAFENYSYCRIYNISLRLKPWFGLFLWNSMWVWIMLKKKLRNQREFEFYSQMDERLLPFTAKVCGNLCNWLFKKRFNF